MKKLTYLFLFILSANVFAQSPAQKSTEWEQLDKAFITVLESLVKKNKQQFIQASLSKVECPDCPEVDEHSKEGAFLPAEIFYYITSENFTQSPIYKALNKRGYRFTSAIMPVNQELMATGTKKGYKSYDVWVDTYLPGEVNKVHKGRGHTFRFVKVNGKFMFYALVSSNHLK